MRPRSRFLLNGTMLVALVAAALGAALNFTPAHAYDTTITVTTNIDELTTNAACSLREALANANLNDGGYPDCANGVGDDQINFNAGYTIELNPAFGSLVVNSTMTISGSGVLNTVIQANACDPTPSVPDCTINNLRVFDFTGGTVTLHGVTLQFGSVSGGSGGGVLVDGAILTIEQSAIKFNEASAGGGGIAVISGALGLYDTTVSGNQAANGGGLIAQTSFEIGSSTISDNSVSGIGGGLYNDVAGSGSRSISNSTFGFNTAGTAVGGIANYNTLTILNTTVGDSTAPGGQVGGVYNDLSGTLTMKNALLANSSGGTTDCASYGTLTWTNNVIENNHITNPCGTPVSGGGDPGVMIYDLNDATPNYPNRTYAIDSSNDAYGAGDSTTCGAIGVSLLDERHYPRKVGCDIGAYEFIPPPVNDDVTSAIHFAALPYRDMVPSVWGATTTQNPPLDPTNCVGRQRWHSVWYTFTAPFSGMLDVNTFGSTYDTVLNVWTGIPGSLSAVTCQDDFGDINGNRSGVRFPVSTGTTYTIEVTSFWINAGTLNFQAVWRPFTDFDGDATTDPAKYLPSMGSVWYFGSAASAWNGAYIGTDGLYVPRSDFDGDGRADAAKFVSSVGALWYQRSSDSSWVGVYVGSDGTYVPGSDFDGDAKTDAAKFVSGTVWYQESSTSLWNGQYIGSDGTYVSGSDFDGDGKTDPAKFVSGTLWYLKSSTSTLGALYLGTDGTYMPSCDFDGDGITDPAKFVSSTGYVWFFKSTSSTWDAKYIGTDGTGVVLASDFDRDGKTDPAKFVATSGSIWYLKSSDDTWGGQYMGMETYDIVN